MKSGSTNEDFDMATESLDTSFQQLMSWMDQLSMAWDALEQCSIDRGLLERIDNLAREAVRVKMSELSSISYSCSLQSKKPNKKSLVHTLDLLEIMQAAKNAKNLHHAVSKQILEAMISVIEVEEAVTEIYNKLIDEESELHRRYDVYLELKIMQRQRLSEEV